MFKTIDTHKKRNHSFVQKPYSQRASYYTIRPQQSEIQPLNYNDIVFKQQKDDRNLLKYANQNISEKKMAKNKRQQYKNDQFLQKVKGMRPSLKEDDFNLNKKIDNYQYLMFQKKIDQAIERKVEELVEKYCEKYFMKFKQAESLSMIDLIKDVQKDVKAKIQKIETNYEKIIGTYDNFLAIVTTLKQQSNKTEKYYKKKDFDNFVKKYQGDMLTIGDKITSISGQVQESLRSIQFNTPKKVFHEMPYALDSEKKETQNQELKTIVSIYNQNFLKIQKKLTLLFTCI